MLLKDEKWYHLVDGNNHIMCLVVESEEFGVGFNLGLSIKNIPAFCGDILWFSTVTEVLKKAEKELNYDSISIRYKLWQLHRIIKSGNVFDERLLPIMDLAKLRLFST